MLGGVAAVIAGITAGTMTPISFRLNSGIEVVATCSGHAHNEDHGHR